jgi:hypothetical protein
LRPPPWLGAKDWNNQRKNTPILRTSDAKYVKINGATKILIATQQLPELDQRRCSVSVEAGLSLDPLILLVCRLDEIEYFCG